MAEAQELRVLVMSGGRVLFEEPWHSILAVILDGTRTDYFRVSLISRSEYRVIFFNQKVQNLEVSRPVCRLIDKHCTPDRATRTVAQANRVRAERSIEAI